MDYPRWQRSYFTAEDEKVLCHNYDIPPSVSSHFLNKSTEMIDGPSDIYIYKRMFMVGVCLPFPPIVRELLPFLHVVPRQLMPNGWRYFFSPFLPWPLVCPGETLSVLEFLNIYRPHSYPTSEIVTFMV